jgi:aspartyl-tRNA(Asn)/glutamyl-tRNA(Gln) amidotransferase subunit A
LLQSFSNFYDESPLPEASGSPLCGIPFAVKESFGIAGRPCEAGSNAWKGRRATTTATAVEKLRSAGMVLVGSCRMTEFAYDAWGINPDQGTPRNPRDLRIHRAPGGSSSGSAVAVAAGLVPVALGTDTGGSVRIPAALCGVVGFKPSQAEIDATGVVPLSPSLDCVGILANDVEMVELACGALRQKPSASGAPGPERLDGLRIGFLPDPVVRELRGDVAAAYSGALRRLTLLGARLVETGHIRTLTSYAREVGQIIRAEAWACHRAWLEEWRGPSTIVIDRIRTGAAITASTYADLLLQRRNHSRAFAGVWGEVDVILTPTTPLPAPAIEEVDRESAILSHFTRAANYLDLCALALPCGRSDDGLPLSLQVLTAPHTERFCLAIGRLLERAAIAERWPTD